MALPRNNFEIEGLDALIKDFAQFGTKAVKKLIPAVDSSSELLLNKTKEKVRQYRKFSKAGQLERSLYIKPEDKKRRYVVAKVLTWGDDVRDYAAPLELGHQLIFMGRRTWRFIAPHPFLRPAADENKATIFDKITTAMDETIKEMGGKK